MSRCVHTHRTAYSHSHSNHSCLQRMQWWSALISELLTFEERKDLRWLAKISCKHRDDWLEAHLRKKKEEDEKRRWGGQGRGGGDVKEKNQELRRLCQLILAFAKPHAFFWNIEIFLTVSRYATHTHTDKDTGTDRQTNTHAYTHILSWYRSRYRLAFWLYVCYGPINILPHT